jgi:hypothetical protein
MSENITPSSLRAERIRVQASLDRYTAQLEAAVIRIEKLESELKTHHNKKRYIDQLAKERKLLEKKQTEYRMRSRGLWLKADYCVQEAERRLANAATLDMVRNLQEDGRELEGLGRMSLGEA